jgi:hypothetical protein
MKRTILMALLSLSAWAGVGKDAWEASNLEGKVRLLQALEDFYAEASKQGAVDEKRTSFLQLLPNAWASVTGMDCVYAGWPSKRSDGRCGSPVSNNPEYSAGSCGGGQMQCQPLLFGPNLCAPVSTSSERSMAFSNCKSRFRADGRTHRGVVETLIRERKGADLTELLDFAERICREGAQATTPMCRRLQEVVAEVRAAMNGLEGVIAAVGDAAATVEDGTRGPASCPPTGGPVLQGGVTPEFVHVPAIPAPAQRREELAPQAARAPADIQAGGTTGTSGGYHGGEEDTQRESSGSGAGYDPSRVPSRARLPERPYGLDLQSPPGNDRDQGRIFAFGSSESLAEVALDIVERVEPSNDAHNWKSVIVMLPRRQLPTRRDVGNEVHMTLPTGEVVVFDGRTNQILRGPLRAGPIDFNPDRHTRGVPDVTYTGAGISIKVDHRFNDPRTISSMSPEVNSRGETRMVHRVGDTTAEVRQGGRVCTVATNLIWEGSGTIQELSDARLVEVLNQHCKPRASPPFALP